MTRIDFPFDVTLRGKLTANEIEVTRTKIARSSLAQDTVKAYPVDFAAMRVHDELASLLPGTAANDDLAIAGDTFGTESPHLSTGDLKGAGSTTRYARFGFQLPVEYDAAETVQVRVHAGMIGSVADTAATVDVESYKSDTEQGIGSDLVTTDAQDANSLTFADFDFDVTATNLSGGDYLDIRLAFLVNDGATGTAVEGVVGYAALLLDVRG